jgi:hypothetical protein
MTGDDRNKARTLYELLAGRGARKDSFNSLVDRAKSFAEFRVLLVCDLKDNKALAAVADQWRRRVAAWVVDADDRKLMHDLEVLSLRQVEIEKLLKANEAALMGKLREVDASASELATLSEKVRESRSVITEYRNRLAELANTARTREITNGIA